MGQLFGGVFILLYVAAVVGAVAVVLVSLWRIMKAQEAIAASLRRLEDRLSTSGSLSARPQD